VLANLVVRFGYGRMTRGIRRRSREWTQR
jgi:hypothetical protein